MNRDDIIRMAIQAGWDSHHAEFDTRIQTLATLVIANHPPQSFMTWQEGCEAGKQAEREACAKVCEEQEELRGHTPFDCATAIRARGQA